MTKSQILLLLDITKKLQKIDDLLYDLNVEGIINFDKIADIICSHFTGKSRDKLDSEIDAPATARISGKPIAWYKTSFDDTKEFIKSKYNLTGYMLECVDDILYLNNHANKSSRKKYKIIKTIFKDIKKVIKEHKRGNK